MRRPSWRVKFFIQAMLRERTKAGLDAARREGRIGGRCPKLTDQQRAEIARMVSKGNKTAADAARLFRVHTATVSRLLSQARAADGTSARLSIRNARSARHFDRK